jgi:hypothetical protein
MSESKSIRQLVEDNVALFLLGGLFTGFVAGWQAFRIVTESGGKKIVSERDFERLESQKTQISGPRTGNKAPEAAPNPIQSTRQGERPVLQTNPPLPDLASFLNAPREGFQWKGYRRQVNELHASVNEFLKYLDHHQGTTYPSVRTFYGAIDEAASILALKAQEAFVAEREADATCGPKEKNYNQKVFIGPSQFMIYVEKLRQEHVRGALTHPLIEDFLGHFDEWRRTEGID